MPFRLSFLTVSCFAILSVSANAQSAQPEGAVSVPLRVAPGAPLRLYLTKRVSKRAGAPVEAKLLEPVFAFDREVIPAGTIVQGEVSRTQGITKWQRTRAILSGDFTPLRSAEVEFTTLTFPDGRKLPIHTAGTVGLNSIYREPSTKQKKKQTTQPQSQNGGILGTAKQAAKDRINGAISARTQSISDVVRGPNKKETLVEMFWAKLPYHPQYVRRGTRFDAPLDEALQFGVAAVKLSDLGQLGLQPRQDSIARVRLLTALDSATTKQGDNVAAVLTAPLFSEGHKLVLPEGTRLTGAVVVAKRARSFHRPGQLRFNFQKIDLPVEVANLRRTEPEPLKTQATLEGAEGSGTAPIKVDPEGGVQAKESKTRFIAPAISLILASRAADNDAGHEHGASASGGNANVSGRTLGGGLGLGMLGAAVSQTSPYVGMAFGYYGLAWSIYSHIIARGGEVQFDENAMMDIKFGARTPAQR